MLNQINSHNSIIKNKFPITTPPVIYIDIFPYTWWSPFWKQCQLVLEKKLILQELVYLFVPTNHQKIGGL